MVGRCSSWLDAAHHTSRQRAPTPPHLTTHPRPCHAVYLAAQAVANQLLGPTVDGKRGQPAANGSHASVAYAPLGTAAFLAGAELELTDLEAEERDRSTVLLAGDRQPGAHTHRK